MLLSLGAASHRKNPEMLADVTPSSSSTELIEVADTSFTGPERHPIYYFKDGIIFLAGDQLFKVPRYMLERNSIVFTDMFSLPSGESGGHGEGLTDDNPIRLPEEVTSGDFQCLLALLYPLTTKYATFTTSWGYIEWMSILKLAAMWEMSEIRMMAIQRLNAIDHFPSPLAKIQYGRKYAYPPWIRAGLSALVTRGEPLSESDGLELGIRDAIRCAAAREKLLKSRKRSTRDNVPDAGNILDEIFGEDIPKIGEGVL